MPSRIPDALAGLPENLTHDSPPQAGVGFGPPSRAIPTPDAIPARPPARVLRDGTFPKSGRVAPLVKRRIVGGGAKKSRPRGHRPPADPRWRGRRGVAGGRAPGRPPASPRA